MVAEPKAEKGQEPERIVATRLPGIEDTSLLSELEQRGVVFSGRFERASWIETMLFVWLLPIALLGASISSRCGGSAAARAHSASAGGSFTPQRAVSTTSSKKAAPRLAFVTCS